MKDREQQLPPPATGRLWLIAALFLVTIPHLLRLPIWLSTACIAVFIWRLLHELRGFDLPGKWLRLFLVVAGIGSVAFVYHSIVGRDPGVALLTVMLCLKMLELRTMRDAMVALFIGYFMVISGFLFSQSIFMGAYLFLVVLALTAALAALNHPSGTRTENRFYLGFAGKLLLQAIPLMVLMFLLFPRLSGPLWQMPSDKRAAKTGLSDSMDIGTINNLANSEEVAFRVDFDGAILPASQLYWRGPILWNTDGSRWEQQSMDLSSNLPSFSIEGNTVSYSITLEPNNRRWLFSLDLPVIMPQGINNKVFARPDFQLLSSRDIAKKVRYSLRSAPVYRATKIPVWMRKLATQLPAQVNPKTRALAQQWKQEGLSNPSIIDTALSLFHDQPFYYTRQPPVLNDNPIDEFLFTTRRGFCEHYAAAFVTLMRAADIPARVVTGYQGGERNALGDYLIIRQSNAHAWAEVWLEQRGWIRVDPTAAIPPERVETSTDANRFTSTDAALVRTGSSLFSEAYWKLRYSWDAINHAWTQWVLGFDKETQEKLLRKLGLNNFSWQWLIILMIAMVGIVLSIIGMSLLWRRPRSQDPVLRLYHQFCHKLAKTGITRNTNEGPSDFANRAILSRPDLAASINAITTHYIQLRYAPMHDSGDIEKLRQLIRTFSIKS